MAAEFPGVAAEVWQDAEMSRQAAYQIDLPHVYSGKVRDIYDAGDDRFLMVTSDRMSAFDVVMDEPVPDKGRVLMAMSAFWFERLAHISQPL